MRRINQLSLASTSALSASRLTRALPFHKDTRRWEVRPEQGRREGKGELACGKEITYIARKGTNLLPKESRRRVDGQDILKHSRSEQDLVVG